MLYGLNMINRRTVASLAAVLLLSVFPLRARQERDTLTVPEFDFQLDSTVLSTKRPRVEILPASDVANIPVTVLRKIPSVMGLADPLRFVFLLPSVQTGNDADNTIHIQGCENAHNYISMDGAPIYGAGHMLGFASVFNANHFSEMSFSTVARDLNRLGGVVDLKLPDGNLSGMGGDFAIGLFLAQATVRVPAGKSSFYLSGRHSYFNLLYSNWMKFNDAPLRYDFGDVNATWIYRPSTRDEVRTNLYYGRDKAEYNAADWQIDAWGIWKNALASVNWHHDGGKWSMDHLAYATFYDLDDRVRIDVTEVMAPSQIHSFGYRGRVHYQGLECIADISRHDTTPLQPTDHIHIRQDALESSFQAGYQHRFGSVFACASLRGTWYVSPERKHFYSADPRLEFAWTSPGAGIYTLKAGSAHQYLFQTGPTGMGFPTEYWILAGELTKPQSSRYLSFSWGSDDLFDGVNLSGEVYYRDLSHQLEYNGNLLDYASPSFDLEACFLRGKGRNYGFNFSLQKTSGRLTGWISYAFGRSLRHSDVPGYPEWYPSIHERKHEVNAVGVYDFGTWDVGLSLVVASGRPWTQPEAFYLLGGKIMTVYGAYNASRLDPYFRADISANWYLHKEARRRDGINFSIYNATAYSNEMGRMIKMNKDDQFYYGSVKLILNIMPSVGYFLHF